MFSKNNVENTLVSAIGKQRFNQIPLFENCLHKKGLVFVDDVDHLGWQYNQDPTFPSIVRGETASGIKFLFLHPQNIDIKTNEPIGKHHIYIVSKRDSLVGFEQTIYPNGFALTSMISDKGVSCRIIETIQNLVSKGFHKNEGVFSKDTKLQLDFLWQ